MDLLPLQGVQSDNTMAGIGLMFCGVGWLVLLLFILVLLVPLLLFDPFLLFVVACVFCYLLIFAFMRVRVVSQALRALLRAVRRPIATARNNCRRPRVGSGAARVELPLAGDPSPLVVGKFVMAIPLSALSGEADIKQLLMRSPRLFAPACGFR